MLYKKIHRQYLRQFWEERRFRLYGRLRIVYRGPYFWRGVVWIDCWDQKYISILSESGKMWYEDLEWID